MKKILIIASTELAVFQMLTHLEQSKAEYINDILIQIESKNLFKFKKNKIFKLIFRKQFYVSQPSLPTFFRIFKFWRILAADKNQIIRNKVLNELKKISFDLENYDEVFFSNETISHYILYNSKVQKTYFNHSPIDTLLNIRLNFFKKIKNFIECYINNKFMNIYYKGNGNFLQKSIFSNYLKNKNSKHVLSRRIFRKIFFKFNKEKVKKISKSDYNLINFYLPYYAFNSKNSEIIVKNYINYFIENIFTEIIKKSSMKDIFLFKFRQTIPKNFQSKVFKYIKIKFPNVNMVLVNKEYPQMVNLEKVILNFKVKRFFTSYSSSIFLGKILSSKILIYSYAEFWDKFVKEYWKFFKHKNNFNNYLLASKLYKNIIKKL